MILIVDILVLNINYLDVVGNIYRRIRNIVVNEDFLVCCYCVMKRMVRRRENGDCVVDYLGGFYFLFLVFVNNYFKYYCFVYVVFCYFVWVL